MNSAGPKTIALRRFTETSIIVLISALAVALPALQAQLTACAGDVPGAAPAVTHVGCHIFWGPILAAFAAALISGLVNGLTAFLTSLHNVVVGPTLATSTPISPTGIVGPTSTFIETKAP